jgi:L-serine dehydratase
MIGPSSSHTNGAVRIGLAARALLQNEPVRARIELHGSFAAADWINRLEAAVAAIDPQQTDADNRLSFSAGTIRGGRRSRSRH